MTSACIAHQLVKRSIRVVKVIICYIDSDLFSVYFEYYAALYN
jgi:hypothetical protein